MFSGDELIPRLTELYRLMDSAYCEVSKQVGFSCEGCDGVKCCTVDLILHTTVEMLYLRRGFNALDVSRQLEILGRCRGIIKAKEDDALGDDYRRAVCALNFEGLCVLYEYRPMICRLAGIPHIIVRPDGTITESGGCVRYHEDFRPGRPDLKIDRTDFYRQMAGIEIEVVRAVGKRTASRTIAETLGLEYPDDSCA
jgi:Fe-S-cluster containining protein